MKLRKNNNKILFDNKVIFNLSLAPDTPIQSSGLPSNTLVILTADSDPVNHGILERSSAIKQRNQAWSYLRTPCLLPSDSIGYPCKSLL